MTSPENRVVSFSTDHKNHPAPYNGALQKEQNILGKKIAEVFFASLFCIKLQKVFVGCCTCIL